MTLEPASRLQRALARATYKAAKVTDRRPGDDGGRVLAVEPDWAGSDAA
jgi:hypothetical protein